MYEYGTARPRTSKSLENYDVLPCEYGKNIPVPVRPGTYMYRRYPVQLYKYLKVPVLISFAAKYHH